MHSRRWVTAGVLGVVLLSTAARANASAITFTLDFTFSGTPPSGFPTVTIDDGGGVGSATVTMNAGGLSGTEFLDDIYLNYGGDPSLLSATYVSGVAANDVQFGSNAFKADGDGFYDILFDFPPPPGASATFGAGESSVYLLTAAGMTANLFNIKSLCDQGCGNGSFFAAAHVQSIAYGTGSGWVGDGTGPPPPPPPPPPPVPEPASLLLFGAGLFGVAVRARKRLATRV